MNYAEGGSDILQLSKTNDMINITEENDEKDFDANMLEKAKGIAWSNIQSRVDCLKGRLSMQSAPGGGLLWRWSLDLVEGCYKLAYSALLGQKTNIFSA